MAYPDYTTSDTSDGTLSTRLLHEEIEAATSTPFDGINQTGTAFNVMFDGTPSGAEETACDAAVAAHTASAAPTPPVVQAVAIIPCCAMGGKSDTLGKFCPALGATTMADDSSKARTRSPVIVPVGTTAKIVGVSYQTNNGTTNVQMKVHLNGSVVETFTLANINANKGGQENWTGFAVVAGDYLELEYDADGGVGDKPGEACWWFLMEITP